MHNIYIIVLHYWCNVMWSNVDILRLHTVWLQIFVVENFCNFRNYIVTKILFSSQLIIIFWCKMSFTSNNIFTGAFQAIVSVLHNLYHLRGVAIVYQPVHENL